MLLFLPSLHTYSFSPYCLFLSIHPRRGSARDCPNQQARERIHNDRHNKECESDFGQRAQMQIARRLGVLVCVTDAIDAPVASSDR